MLIKLLYGKSKNDNIIQNKNIVRKMEKYYICCNAGNTKYFLFTKAVKLKNLYSGVQRLKI